MHWLAVFGAEVEKLVKGELYHLGSIWLLR